MHVKSIVNVQSRLRRAAKKTSPSALAPPLGNSSHLRQANAVVGDEATGDANEDGRLRADPS
eukprot:758103-Hanusia_phi.AAC.3